MLASRDPPDNLELLERTVVLAGPHVNQCQVGNGELLLERYRFLRLL